jgi:replicative DNA helicase
MPTRSRNQHDLVTPPHSQEAEESVLGGVMISPDALDEVIDLLAPEDFYRRDNQLIYRLLLELHDASEPMDVITVDDRAKRHHVQEQIGGLDRLVALAKTVPSAANIRAYAEIVRDKALLRRMAEVGTDISRNAMNPGREDVGSLVASAEQKVYALSESSVRGKSDFAHLRQALREAFEQLQQRHENPGVLTGVATGYSELDDMTAGLQPSDLIILAGRPSMGKTSLALNIAENVAAQTKRCVVVFSMEMSSPQLAMRMIASQGRVNATRLRTGALEDQDWPRVNAAIRAVSAMKLLIDDTPALSPEQIRAKVRRVKRTEDVALIVIDYLQLMTSHSGAENRTNEISEISRGLKALAKEMNVPVLALSQLNRSVESRADKRPLMSDLRESGAIEQDADVIAFVYRDEYYHRDSPDQGLAEVIIAKQRNGPTGTVRLKFFGEFTRFDDLAPGPTGSFE